MEVLVADSSVVIDLERGDLVDPMFGLDHHFVIPDVLFEFELRPHGGERLLELGLEVVELDEANVMSALDLGEQCRSLSVSDVFAFSLAKGNSWALLASDGELRMLAQESGLICHGLLWLLDEIHRAEVIPTKQLHASLSRIACHPRCRLPDRETHKRLKAYAKALKGS